MSAVHNTTMPGLQTQHKGVVYLPTYLLLIYLLALIACAVVRKILPVPRRLSVPRAPLLPTPRWQ